MSSRGRGGGSRRRAADEEEDVDALLEDVEELAVKDADATGPADDDEDDGVDLGDDEADDGDGGEEDEDEEDEGPGRRPLVAKGPDMSARQLTGHGDAVYCLAVSHDGQRVLSGAGDDAARIWNLRTGACEHVLSGHTESINACGWNHNDSLVATGALDGGIRVWSAATGECLCVLEGPGGEVNFVAWHPRGDVLAAGSADTTVWMWAITSKVAAGSSASAAGGASAAPPVPLSASADVMQVFVGHEGEVLCGSWTSSGKGLLTGDSEGSMRLWNPKSGSAIVQFSGRDGHEGPVNALWISRDKPIFVSASQDGCARIVNFATGKTLAVLRHLWRGPKPDEKAEAKAKEAEEAAAAAAAAAEGGAGAGAPAVERKGDDEGEEHPSIECVALTDDETFLAAGGTDGSVTVWDVAAGRGKVRHVLAHEDTVVRCTWLESVLPAAATPAARAAVAGKLACACADGTVAVWDARDGRRMAYLTGHAGMIIDMALSLSFAGSAIAADKDAAAAAAAAGEAAPAAAASSSAAAASSDAGKIAVVTAGDDSVVRAFVIDPLVVMPAPVPLPVVAPAADADAAPAEAAAAEGGAGSADAPAPAASGSA